jgi:hypothetical protein
MTVLVELLVLGSHQSWRPPSWPDEWMVIGVSLPQTVKTTTRRKRQTNGHERPMMKME